VRLDDGLLLQLGDVLGHGSFATAYESQYHDRRVVVKVHRLAQQRLEVAAAGAGSSSSRIRGTDAATQELECLRAIANIRSPAEKALLPALVVAGASALVLTPRGRPLAAVMSDLDPQPFGDGGMSEPAVRDAVADWRLAVEVWRCLVRALAVLHLQVRRSHGDLRLANVIEVPGANGGSSDVLHPPPRFMPIDFGLSQPLRLTDREAAQPAVWRDLEQALDVAVQVAIGGLQALPCEMWARPRELPGLAHKMSIPLPACLEAVVAANRTIQVWSLSHRGLPSIAQYRSLEGLLSGAQLPTVGAAAGVARASRG